MTTTSIRSSIMVFGQLLILAIDAATVAAELPLLDVSKHQCVHDIVTNDRGPASAEGARHRNARGNRWLRDAGRCSAPEIIARDQFRGLRVNVTYDNADTYFPNVTARQILQRQVATIVTQLYAMFSVYPVSGSLVLPRCSDTEKCQEVCGINPQVLIPDDYLESRNQSGSNRGGIPDADIVIFFTGSYDNSLCSKALAYATICKRNNVGRPIAAAIQICPRPLEDLPEDFLYQVILHEMFHALAFTRDSFNLFVDRSSLNCTKYSKPVRDNLNLQKLITPATLNAASSHFNCVNPSVQSNEYGGPLDTISGPDVQIGSHWNESLMQGSLMTAVVPQARVVLLDKITLAVFDDSGWYGVNYSFAQPFMFGRSAGCTFASEAFCATDNVFYCQGSNTTGCHYLHRDKGTCNAMSGTVCRTYVAGRQTACYDPLNPAARNATLTGERYDTASRCFMSSLRPASGDATVVEEVVGRCYQHACNGSSLMIKAWNMTDWQLCPYNTTIEVAGYTGFVRCPLSGILCSDVDTIASKMSSPMPTMSTSAPITSSPVHDGGTNSLAPSIPPGEMLKIVFPALNLTELQQLGIADNFTDAVSAAIRRLVNISADRLAATTLQPNLPGNGTYYQCLVLHPSVGAAEDMAATDVVSHVYEAVRASRFSVTVDLVTYTASLAVDVMSTTTNIRSIVVSTVAPTKIGSSSASVAIGVALGLAVIAVALVIACICVRRRWRKRRASASIAVSMASNATASTVCTVSVNEAPADQDFPSPIPHR